MICRLCLLLIAVCSVLSTKAQQHRPGSWSEVALSHSLNKKWSAGAGLQMRKYPVAFNSQYIAEAGVSRQLAKRLKAGAGYRFTLKDVGFEQRVQFDVAYQLRFKGFQLTERARYQYEWDNRLRHANYIRNKATLKYRNFKRVTPLLAAEAFYRADFGYHYVDQLRFFAGADYKINKQWEAGLQWIHTRQVQVATPLITDVLYVGLSYDLPRAKKKKGKGKNSSSEKKSGDDKPGLEVTPD